MQIKKTVTREVEEIDSVTCNACGQTKPDTTPIDASGGYESTALFDMRHYMFDLCEECLVTIMNGLKIPPLVIGEEDGLTWEIDRASFEKGKKIVAAKDEAERAAIDAGVCSHRMDSQNWESTKRCGEAPAMRVNYGRGFESVCALHGIDAYGMRHCVIERDGETLTFGIRAGIGSRYLRSLLSIGPKEFKPLNLNTRIICISTCFPLLMQPKWAALAMRELHLLTDAAPKPVAQWTNHRLPHRFPPGDERATFANAWLAWGRDHGYINATAHGFIGCNATSLWTEEDTRDSEDDE